MDKEFFNLSQEIRFVFPSVAFANYKCGCDEGMMIFDSKTQTPLLRVSKKRQDKMGNLDFRELLGELHNARNRLNRRIATLKKANLQN